MMPEQHTTAPVENQSKKTWLDTLFELAIAFRSASLASGGSTTITGSNSDTITTNEVFLNQASLAVFFGGVIFLLLAISLCFDCCTGRVSQEGLGRTLALKVNGKKRQVVLSALFSLAGGAMMFTQAETTSSERNKYVFAFSILSQLFSGVLIGPDAAKLPGRVGQFFQDPSSPLSTFIRTAPLAQVQIPTASSPLPFREEQLTHEPITITSGSDGSNENDGQLQPSQTFSRHARQPLQTHIGGH